MAERRAGPQPRRSTSLVKLGRSRRKRKVLSLDCVLARFASRMRRAPTPAELVLKKRLDAAGIENVFQSPRNDPRRRLACILDFRLPRKVVVEVDGGYHLDLDQQAKDFIRDNALKWAGFKVLRFTNDEVFKDADLVVRVISEELSLRGHRVDPPPETGRGG